jgi:hypothetical protein
LNAVTVSSGVLNPFQRPYAGGTSYCSNGFDDVNACVAEEIANGNAFNAVRINWSFNVDGDANDSVEPFQIVFRDLSASGAVGDFDMEINYDPRLDPVSGLYSPFFDFGGGLASWSIADIDNPVFTFRNGMLVTDTPPPVGVPEPEALAVFAVGLVALACVRRRREGAANQMV